MSGIRMRITVLLHGPMALMHEEPRSTGPIPGRF